jgi:hypothetical protein
MITPEEAADDINRKRASLERGKKEALINRFKLFLLHESAMGDAAEQASHPANLALQAFEAGKVEVAAQYLDAEISRVKAAKAGTDDETAKARLDVRQSDLERWKQNLI